MGVFGFIENFFFVSLGIVFVLILLLVYHFKKRMSVAEKKSESMYGLLTTIVKEIKNIRSTFGTYSCKSSAAPAQAPASDPVVSNKLKTEPEINVSITPFHIQNAKGTQCLRFAKSVAHSSDISAHEVGELNEKRCKSQPVSSSTSPEVITLDLAATEIPTLSRGGLNKIVVSEDDESDAETESDNDKDEIESGEEDSDTDDDTEHESSDFDESDDEEVENIVLEPFYDSQHVEHKDLTVEHFESTNVLEELQLDATIVNVDANEPTVPEVVNVLEDFSVAEVEPTADSNTIANNEVESNENVISVASKPDKLSADHLRKMNINQLRTIAIQRGITADTSKMKKNELITLIQSE